MSKQESDAVEVIEAFLVAFILYGLIRVVDYFTSWDHNQFWVGAAFLFVFFIIMGYRSKKVDK